MEDPKNVYNPITPEGLIQRANELKAKYPIRNQDVYGFLRSKMFMGEFQTLLNFPEETGFSACMDPKGKYVAVRHKDSDLRSSNPDTHKMDELALLNFFDIHCHSREGVTAGYIQVPSEQDLVSSKEESSTFFDWETDKAFQLSSLSVLLVQGSRPLVWLWKTHNLQDRIIRQVYKAQFSHTRSPEKFSYQDIEDLHTDLRQIGLQIEKRYLDPKDIQGSFASFVEDFTKDYPLGLK